MERNVKAVNTGPSKIKMKILVYLSNAREHGQSPVNLSTMIDFLGKSAYPALYDMLRDGEVERIGERKRAKYAITPMGEAYLTWRIYLDRNP